MNGTLKVLVEYFAKVKNPSGKRKSRPAEWEHKEVAQAFGIVTLHSYLFANLGFLWKTDKISRNPNL